MKVQFDRSFYKSIKSLNNAAVKSKLAHFITSCEKADNLHSLPNIKKLQGFSTFYRYRIGDYRVGFELVNDTTILFIIVCHQKDIYKLFP